MGRSIFVQTYGWPLFRELELSEAGGEGMSADTLLVFQALAEGLQLALA